MASPKPQLMTAVALYKFEHITDAQISPDGRFVIYTQRRVDEKTERKYSNLWLVPTGAERPTWGKQPRQFTIGDQVDVMPRWSPDGRQIAFLSNRKSENQMQIYLIPLDGGEARPLTDLKGSIADFAWSPDGKKLVCQFREKDPAEVEREKDEQKKKLGIVSRHITDRIFFKLDGAGYVPEMRWHLWLIDAQSGKATPLTNDPLYDDGDVSWSPDGRFLIFTSNRTPDTDLHPDQVDLFLLPVTAGKADPTALRRLETPLGPKSMPVFSPDGRWIAYLGGEGEGQWWQNTSLWVMPADGSTAPRNLTETADLQLSPITGGDTGTGLWIPPTWSPDGQHIYFQASWHGDTALMSATAHTETPTITRVVAAPGVIETFSFDATHQWLAYVLNTMTDPGQLFVQQMGKPKASQLTQLNGWMKRLDLGQVEELWFKARDGYDLHGWILYPPGFDAQQRYPSILQIHGGPQTQYGRSFMHEFFFLAAQGYVVYFSNPRGSQGYGNAHAQAIQHAWGTVDYDDVMDWAEYMRQQPYIDPERMGVTGGSYGGYMTNMIIGRSQMFKAAVTQRSVSNLVSMWGSSDFNWAFQQSVGQNQPPFVNLELYWNQSPMKYVGQAKTPTLIIHSEQDQRVAQEQGEQVYVALKTLGVPTELLLFPDEPHGLSRTGRTDRRIVRLNHILGWFERFLK